MGVIVALGGCAGLRVDVKRIIRASLHARFAADAAIIVEINDAIITDEECLCRADSYTGRIGAMVAAGHGKHAPGIRKNALFGLFHEGAIDTNGHIVFRFASYRAGVAANAFAVVYNKSKFHVVVFSRKGAKHAK